MKQFFFNAKIILATTTPMSPGYTSCTNPRTNEEIRKYNEIVLSVAKRENIYINDLYQFTETWDESRYRDYAHFTEEGFELIGNKVTDVLRNVI